MKLELDCPSCWHVLLLDFRGNVTRVYIPLTNHVFLVPIHKTKTTIYNQRSPAY